MPYLNSSAIARVKYDAYSQVLQIWFRGGGHAYSYYGVPDNIYRGLITAPSAGRFYDQNIKDHYRYR